MNREASAAIAQYRLPNGSAVPAALLPLIRELALGAVPVNAREAQVNCRAIVALIEGRLAEGLPVTGTGLLDPAGIARHLTHLAPKRRGQVFSLHRHALARIAGEPPIHVDDDGHAPYSPIDVDRLLNWADRLQGSEERHGILAVLAFGLGAGLGRPDLLLLSGTDIEKDPTCGMVTVQVGDRRLVPVLRLYEALTTELAAAAGNAWVLRPEPVGTPRTDRAYRHLLVRVRVDPRLPVLTARRCRNTWLHTHLASGTPVHALLQAAGMVPKNLAPHLAYLAPMSDSERDAAMRLA